MTDYVDKNRLDRLEEAHAALDSKFERLMQHFVTMDERVTDFMVDCQKQSIAALEAKVDQMNPNDEGLHTLPEETPAQQRYREANERHYSNREVEMAAGAFDRAEEVAQDLDDWTHLIHMGMNTTSRRLTALESPAPAPDPVCQCGHEKSRHMYFACHKLGCTCTGFVPAAEPAPLDPVLVDEIAALIANRVLHPNEVFMTGPYRVPSEERRCKEAAQEIVYMLTYGRDGGR